MCLVCGAQGVKDSPELRAAVEEVQPENVKLSLRLSQSRCGERRIERRAGALETHRGAGCIQDTLLHLRSSKRVTKCRRGTSGWV